MVSGYPLDAVAQQNHAPIDDQPQRQAAQLQVCQQLTEVDGKNFFDRLVFHQHLLVDSHVDARTDLNKQLFKL